MVEIRKITIPNGKLEMLSRKYGDKSALMETWTMEQLSGSGVNSRPDLPRAMAVNFSNSALARYISMLFYQGNGDLDGARIEHRQLLASYAANRNIYRNPLPKAVDEALNIPAGKGRLNILAFTGLSPLKAERQIQHFFPFFRTPILRTPVLKLPVLVNRPSTIDTIEVVLNNGQKFNLELLEDMGTVMRETYNASYSNTVLKTYIRVMLKYAATDIAATAGAMHYSAHAGRSLAIEMSAIAAKLAIDASESADIRMSRYLPDRAYIGGINLDPGIYAFKINYYSGGKLVAHDEHTNISVRSGTLNLAEAACLR
jgi:hypothetical protein